MHTAEPDDGLTPYERERAERMAKNNAVMKSLGLPTLGAKVGAPPLTPAAERVGASAAAGGARTPTPFKPVMRRDANKPTPFRIVLRKRTFVDYAEGVDDKVEKPKPRPFKMPRLRKPHGYSALGVTREGKTITSSDEPEDASADPFPCDDAADADAAADDESENLPYAELAEKYADPEARERALERTELYYANPSEWIDVVRNDWLALFRMKKQSRLAAEAAEKIAADQAAAAKVAAAFGAAPASGGVRRSPRSVTAVKGAVDDVDGGNAAAGGSVGDASGDAGAHGTKEPTETRAAFRRDNVTQKSSRRFFGKLADNEDIWAVTGARKHFKQASRANRTFVFSGEPHVCGNPECRRPDKTATWRGSRYTPGRTLCAVCYDLECPDDRRCAECDKDKTKVSAWRASKLKPGNWLCPPCAKRECPDDRRCAECDKDKTKVSGWCASKLKPGDWLCQPCAKRECPDDRRCAECDKDKTKVSGWSASKLKPGDWLCQPCAKREVPDGQTCAKCGCDKNKTSAWVTSKGVFAAKGAALCKKCSGSEPPYLGAKCSVATCGKTETVSWRTSKVRAGELICKSCYDREKKLLRKNQAKP